MEHMQPQMIHTKKKPMLHRFITIFKLNDNTYTLEDIAGYKFLVISLGLHGTLEFKKSLYHYEVPKSPVDFKKSHS